MNNYVWLRRSFALFLAFVYALSVQLVQVDGNTISINDREKQSAAFERWDSLGVLDSIPGAENLDATLTRAQFAALLDNILGCVTEANAAFFDVGKEAWYRGAMLRLVAAGVLLDKDGYLYPDEVITWEEAEAMLGRAFHMEDALDCRKNGDEEPVTMGQMLSSLSGLIGLYVNEKGEYSGNVEGIVIINAPDVTLKDINAGMGIYISEGAGRSVTLDGVSTEGALVLGCGGGINLYIKDSAIGCLALEAPDGLANVYLLGSSNVGLIDLGSGAFIDASGVKNGAGAGRVLVRSDIRSGQPLSLIGSYGVLENRGYMQNISLSGALGVLDLLAPADISGAGEIARMFASEPSLGRISGMITVGESIEGMSYAGWTASNSGETAGEAEDVPEEREPETPLPPFTIEDVQITGENELTAAASGAYPRAIAAVKPYLGLVYIKTYDVDTGVYVIYTERTPEPGVAYTLSLVLEDGRVGSFTFTAPGDTAAHTGGSVGEVTDVSGYTPGQEGRAASAILTVQQGVSAAYAVTLRFTIQSSLQGQAYEEITLNPGEAGTPAELAARLRGLDVPGYTLSGEGAEVIVTTDEKREGEELSLALTDKLVQNPGFTAVSGPGGTGNVDGGVKASGTLEITGIAGYDCDIEVTVSTNAGRPAETVVVSISEGMTAAEAAGLIAGEDYNGYKATAQAGSGVVTYKAITAKDGENVSVSADEAESGQAHRTDLGFTYTDKDAISGVSGINPRPASVSLRFLDADATGTIKLRITSSEVANDPGELIYIPVTAGEHAGDIAARLDGAAAGRYGMAHTGGGVLAITASTAVSGEVLTVTAEGAPTGVAAAASDGGLGQAGTAGNPARTVWEASQPPTRTGVIRATAELYTEDGAKTVTVFVDVIPGCDAANLLAAELLAAFDEEGIEGFEVTASAGLLTLTAPAGFAAPAFTVEDYSGEIKHTSAFTSDPGRRDGVTWAAEAPVFAGPARVTLTYDEESLTEDIIIEEATPEALYEAMTGVEFPGFLIAPGDDEGILITPENPCPGLAVDVSYATGVAGNEAATAGRAGYSTTITEALAEGINVEAVINILGGETYVIPLYMYILFEETATAEAALAIYNGIRTRMPDGFSVEYDGNSTLTVTASPEIDFEFTISGDRVHFLEGDTVDKEPDYGYAVSKELTLIQDCGECGDEVSVSHGAGSVMLEITVSGTYNYDTEYAKVFDFPGDTKMMYPSAFAGFLGSIVDQAYAEMGIAWMAAASVTDYEGFVKMLYQISEGDISIQVHMLEKVTTEQEVVTETLPVMSWEPAGISAGGAVSVSLAGTSSGEAFDISLDIEIPIGTSKPVTAGLIAGLLDVAMTDVPGVCAEAEGSRVYVKWQETAEVKGFHISDAGITGSHTIIEGEEPFARLSLTLEEAAEGLVELTLSNAAPEIHESYTIVINAGDDMETLAERLAGAIEGNASSAFTARGEDDRVIIELSGMGTPAFGHTLLGVVTGFSGSAEQTAEIPATPGAKAFARLEVSARAAYTGPLYVEISDSEMLENTQLTLTVSPEAHNSPTALAEALAGVIATATRAYETATGELPEGAAYVEVRALNAVEGQALALSVGDAVFTCRVEDAGAVTGDGGRGSVFAAVSLELSGMAEERGALEITVDNGGEDECVRVEVRAGDGAEDTAYAVAMAFAESGMVSVLAVGDTLVFTSLRDIDGEALTVTCDETLYALGLDFDCRAALTGVSPAAPVHAFAGLELRGSAASPGVITLEIVSSARVTVRVTVGYGTGTTAAELALLLKDAVINEGAYNALSTEGLINVNGKDAVHGETISVNAAFSFGSSGAFAQDGGHENGAVAAQAVPASWSVAILMPLAMGEVFTVNDMAFAFGEQGFGEGSAAGQASELAALINRCSMNYTASVQGAVLTLTQRAPGVGDAPMVSVK